MLLGQLGWDKEGWVVAWAKGSCVLGVLCIAGLLGIVCALIPSYVVATPEETATAGAIATVCAPSNFNIVTAITSPVVTITRPLISTTGPTPTRPPMNTPEDVPTIVGGITPIARLSPTLGSLPAGPSNSGNIAGATTTGTPNATQVIGLIAIGPSPCTPTPLPPTVTPIPPTATQVPLTSTPSAAYSHPSVLNEHARAAYIHRCTANSGTGTTANARACLHRNTRASDCDANSTDQHAYPAYRNADSTHRDTDSSDEHCNTTDRLLNPGAANSDAYCPDKYSGAAHQPSASARNSAVLALAAPLHHAFGAHAHRYREALAHSRCTMFGRCMSTLRGIGAHVLHHFVKRCVAVLPALLMPNSRLSAAPRVSESPLLWRGMQR